MLEHFGDAEPSGPNLEYDPEYVALAAMTAPAQLSQFGAPKGKSAEPKYTDIIEAAESILARSHDLRVAIWLAEAKVPTEGLPGLAPVTQYIRGCLEQFWDSCHPQLDADDDNDPSMRINALVGLAASDGLPADLRLTPLAESPAMGRFSLRDIMIATGEIDVTGDDGDGGGAAPDQSTIAAAFRSTPKDRLRANLDAARKILADIEAVNSCFDDRTPGQGPMLDPLLAIVRRIVKELADAAGEPADGVQAVDDGGAAETGGADSTSSAGGGVGGVPGAITSRRDVEAALDRIIAYFETNEPSSPLPIVLRRARRLVGADFLTIMKDIAPGGLDTVRQVGGLEDDEDD